MAVFHAFRALRPTPEKAADVAALPYDVVNREEAKSIGDENPCPFFILTDRKWIWNLRQICMMIGFMKSKRKS